ncbi:Hypothetical protein FNO222_1501 [Francisella orientalis]|uniref:Uncharacterized protein n=1 Tax=Francisella orientalis TaxID=299583 RepID=A0ABM5U846_9GAMM|nr:hypothetical protein FNO12_1488 [Francisella orientalis FNO12]AKN87579.1 Hypothetical protein FNO24_1490 [Francisella orientalis FNO24]AKN89117.1 Hypothetical protein FNO190_1488 [Francisella orientalis]AKU05876.1 Hypothetical protein FNO01_1488 [Francisella orientalis]QEN20792.1 Hypothetical protein FNO39_1501 [Francisella orientalis]
MNIIWRMLISIGHIIIINVKIMVSCFGLWM